MTDSAIPAAVSLRKVEKYYGSYHALRTIDLEVAPRERVVVCGPSGSGKSTLIRCMNLLEVPDSGAVLIEGTKVTGASRDAAAALRSVGMVFQQFNLFPHKTVLENCTLAPVLVGGVALPEAEARAMSYLEKVRIADQANKYPGQLSGGQQQRAAIARALAMEPRILLFDEPTSALDPEMIKEVLDVMTALAGEGRTMVCVTHEMGFAREAADRILFMDQGQVIEDAKPVDFFAAPKSERARTFLEQILSH
ncbi:MULTISPECIES: amino acid ABC transporter ATP-binding protein [unclassified Sphingopyxis]|uniref:amino acid ABC transporter ATP-binding protein n=1 Tax=unclassified Sphingopyxis TaxID=2614943 RepID=UPI000731CC9F|nr:MULTISPECIES: amino acid ABC transporter ATP-binding protein [unclassified Sphingopyxis]KTE23418.1 glutamine ABC transporter ATP-binding protein [Sphingopyxis sp. H057]KTE49826.1 glutamine ABC transporter ATP-binding protein [Sphingopyxis sp. H073]KTE50349.1 glutamine ABC transporter ATP-binding protein [Sphingopyxis sp. H071]KTE58613.1 glutamine ABC transporter ATP-binding protein [Sphingopyxis sp. H107]KTE59248.1 glutamine ABC transporter ATP-binding protein [Sphingopyxis sp. H100]